MQTLPLRSSPARTSPPERPARRALLRLSLAAALLLGCTIPAEARPPTTAHAAPADAPCGGPPMTVRFYDVGQALAVLIDLPDGRSILVDSGEAPDRAACGPACQAWSTHLLDKLDEDLPQGHVDALWITHMHSDHLGNAAAVLRRYDVGVYVDNGTDTGKKMVAATREAAAERGVPVVAVDPEHRESPVASSRDVTIRAVLPAKWPGGCGSDPNDCSIGLRVDYCRSSVLITGDAEEQEETTLDIGGAVTLLQVGHHGSDTSSSAAFLDLASPRYAVISAGKAGEGPNRSFCHPRRATVQALSDRLGGPATQLVSAFDGGQTCKGPHPVGWGAMSASDRLFITARDGDVVLTTHGDGLFERAPAAAQ